MRAQEDIKTIKDTTREFFEKMTLPAQGIEARFEGEENNAVNLNVETKEPQILIGESGQTLLEIQRILRLVLNKKTQKIFYLNLDINSYKHKKTEYLKSIARNLADEVVFNKEEKVLNPMPAYERRIIHAELSGRSDVATESRGEGQNRYIVIKPK